MLNCFGPKYDLDDTKKKSREATICFATEGEVEMYLNSSWYQKNVSKKAIVSRKENGTLEVHIFLKNSCSYKSVKEKAWPYTDISIPDKERFSNSMINF